MNTLCKSYCKKWLLVYTVSRQSCLMVEVTVYHKWRKALVWRIWQIEKIRQTFIHQLSEYQTIDSPVHESKICFCTIKQAYICYLLSDFLWCLCCSGGKTNGLILSFSLIWWLLMVIVTHSKVKETNDLYRDYTGKSITNGYFVVHNCWMKEAIELVLASLC